MTSVAPEAAAMSRDGFGVELTPQPHVPGNACPLQCCGASPGPIDVAKIARDGGRFVQVGDGRIVEYFVYGSDDPGARVMLQIAGSMGTGALFKDMEGMMGVLREHNIRGISITVPGHGYSSNHPTRRIGDWPREDCEPVFAKEGVDGPFMLEGHSFGTAHALAVMHHFGARVTAMHLHLPYLPIPIRKEKGMKEVLAHDLIKGDHAWAATIAACPTFCMCSAMMGCAAACPCLSADPKMDADAGFPFMAAVGKDTTRSAAGSIHGLVYNALVPMISADWGFDLLGSDVAQTKVLVSYGDADNACPPEHGNFLYEHYKSRALAAEVQVGKGGHEAHMGAMARGEQVRKLLAM